MQKKILRLSGASVILFLIVYGIALQWFPHEELQESLLLQDITELNALAVRIGDLLESPEDVKTREIQQIIESEEFGEMRILYLDWNVKFTSAGADTQPVENKQIYQVVDDHIILRLPVGRNKIRGLLEVKREIFSPSAAYANWLPPFIFSLGITALAIAGVLWIKARKMTRPIDQLCQAFTRYRREQESSDLTLPRSLPYQTGLERRVSVLHDLWGKFQTVQEQLAGKVDELEESKQTLEQTIRDLELAKEQEKRLVELGYALAEFGHDIGNANGSVVTYVGLILQILDKEHVTMLDIARSLMYVRRIKISAMTVTGLTTDILEFAKGKTDLRRSTTQLEPFISHLEINTGFVADLPIHFSTPNPNLSFYGDVNKLTRVVINLIKNSWEKLGEQEDGEITVLFDVFEENGLMIQIRDNGTPIPEHVLPHLFKSFKTEGKESGTGLGLAICKKIIDAHDGRILAENLSANRGVQFTIYLPRCLVKPEIVRVGNAVQIMAG
ncbi:MAG: HAMP domain-containing histidine kinase [SAR324 cluster bacterium]|nr:HAMP domain-containing histidine kinase [SAR324 cluster bacterium]